MAFSGRSTTTNVLLFQNCLLDAYKTNCPVDVIYTDFSKTFGEIDHTVLTTKLHNLGFCYVSFITGRKQCLSKKLQDASFGFPQGCHLVSFLFNIYVNYISNVTSHLLLFSVELKLFWIIKSPNDA